MSEDSSTGNQDLRNEEVWVLPQLTNMPALRPSTRRPSSEMVRASFTNNNL